MKKIAITGPESSGKTSLAEALAEALACPVVPEYARSYLSRLQPKSYTMDDFKYMASHQERLQKWYEKNNSKPFLILDTDFLVYKVWSEVRYGCELPLIAKLRKRNPSDVHFLCCPDMPWESDPLREHPNDRQALFERYRKHLESLGVSFLVLHGSLELRLADCLAYLSK